MINLVKDIGEMSVRVHHLSGQVDNLTNNWRATRTAIEKLEESYTNLSKESTQVHLKAMQSSKAMIKTMENVNELLLKQNHTKKTAKAQELNAGRKLRKIVAEENEAIKQSIQDITTAMQTQQATQQDAAKLIKEEKERAKALENLKNKYNELTKAEVDAESKLDTRSRIMSQAISKYKKETNQAKLPFFEGMSRYLEEGGTKAEYLAQFLTSTREELKIFGVEVSSVRKFMYGFLPPGTFRLVNKFSTALNFVGGTMRSLSADAENTTSIVSTLFASTLDKKGFKKLQEKKAKVQEDMGKLQVDMTAKEDIISNSSSSAAEIESATEALEYLKEIEIKLTEQEADIDKNIERQGGVIAKYISNSAFGKAGIGLGETLAEYGEAVNNYLEEVAENGTFLKKLLARIALIMLGVGKFIFMASMYLLLFGLGFFLVFKFFKNNADRFSTFFDAVMPLIAWFFSTALDGVMDVISGIVDIFTGIYEGDFGMILEGLGTMALGIGKIIVGIIGGLLLLAGSAAVSVIFVLLTHVWDFLTDWSGGWYDKVSTVIAIVATIAAMMFIVSLLPIQLPIILVAALSYVMFKLIKSLPFMATGGVSAGGLTVVGEKGPELVNLSKGSRVHSNAESRKMVSGGGGTVNNFNITVNAKDSSKAEMRRMADEIGKMISSKINRSTSSSTLR